MKFHLWVAGDPFMDAFFYGQHQGKRFHVERQAHCAGGGFNTLANAMSLARDSDIVEIIPLMSEEATYMNTLTRLIDTKKNATILEYWDREADEITEMCNFHWYDYQCDYDTLGHGLVLSDYNKGALNHPPMRPVSLVADFLIADSRYRTLHPDFMKLAKTKIWHATGSEYDRRWAQDMGFDYVFQTNGANPVIFGSTKESESHKWETLEVPDVKAVDTVGAGDTFTAAVGAYLAHHVGGHARPIDMKLLRGAGEFAIECCQEVIQQPRTAVTTKRI